MSDLGTTWYVIEDPKGADAAVVAGPYEESRDARSRASVANRPAEATLAVRLVHNIEANDYDVEWRDGVEKPEALRDDGGNSEIHV